MGNRAVLTFDVSPDAPAIYLHWNGGRASVEGFLQAARDLGLRYCGADPGVTMDRLAELIAVHFFGGKVGQTVYRDRYGRTDYDNGDNGVYVLTHDLQIGQRLYVEEPDEVDPVKAADTFEHIAQRAPAFSFEPEREEEVEDDEFLLLREESREDALNDLQWLAELDQEHAEQLQAAATAAEVIDRARAPSDEEAEAYRRLADMARRQRGS
jgi:hypothetical protein